MELTEIHTLEVQFHNIVYIMLNSPPIQIRDRGKPPKFPFFWGAGNKDRESVQAFTQSERNKKKGAIKPLFYSKRIFAIFKAVNHFGGECFIIAVTTDTPIQPTTKKIRA